VLQGTWETIGRKPVSGSIFEPGTTGYKAAMLTTQLWCSVVLCFFILR